MGIIFTKTNSTIRQNKVFILLTYMGGDADTWHKDEIEMEGLSFENKDSKSVIDIIKKYKRLGIILEYRNLNYESVEEMFGQEMAKLYENVPFDPANDFQDKTILFSIEVLAYDNKGQEYIGIYTK